MYSGIKSFVLSSVGHVNLMFIHNTFVPFVFKSDVVNSADLW